MIKRTKKMTLVATTILTLLSGTVAMAMISMAKKASATNDELKKEENGEFKTVLDGLVNVGTITRAQEVAIRSALKASKEAALANQSNRENREHEAILNVSDTGTLMSLKKSIFRARSPLRKKPTQHMAI